jgi:hypothetical protein
MMKTNFFLTIVKSWMEVYFTKPGEECDNLLWSHLNDRNSGENLVTQARVTRLTIAHHVLKYFMHHVPTLSCLKLCPN